MKLLYKIQINGIITLQTGMHIGGSEVDLEIGGIDKAVVKDKSTGHPYIPGSSLKGKLRDLIAKSKDYTEHAFDLNEVFILFGDGATDKHRNAGHLIVRDSFYIGDFDSDKNLEEKSENTINRVTGAANPRSMERVVRGAEFFLDMILDVYDEYSVKTGARRNGRKVDSTYTRSTAITAEGLLKTLKTGFGLLSNDYIGGSGTRGYGKVTLQLHQPVKIQLSEDGVINREKIEFNLNS